MSKVIAEILRKSKLLVLFLAHIQVQKNSIVNSINAYEIGNGFGLVIFIPGLVPQL